MFKAGKAHLQFYSLAGIALFIPVVLSFLFVNYRTTRDQMEQSYNQNLKAEFDIIIDVYSDLSDLIYKTQINREEVKKIFASAVRTEDRDIQDFYRAELFQELSEIYDTIQGYNFRQLHFHDSRNRSFLRFHSLQKYGDDLTGIRYSVEYVNREKEPISGFEEGRIFNGYRFVYPLENEGEHLGSVEISISMKTVIDQWNQRFGQVSQFIILKEQVEEKVFDTELSNYIPWTIDDTYLLDKAISSECILVNRVSDEDINNIKEALLQHQGGADPFSVELKVDGEYTLVSFLPIFNFDNEYVACLFTLFDGDDLHRLDLYFYFTCFLMTILFLLLLSFSFYSRAYRRKIETLATFDSLTKAYVRREILEQIKARFEIFKRYKNPFSVIMLDIDYFKKVNDRFGHSVGDLVLAGVAQIVQANIRSIDLLGRYGGEEFIILLPETNRDKACIVAEKIRRHVCDYHFHQVGQVTISLGVSEAMSYMEDFEKLIIKVDENLYKAKNQGRNRVI